MLDELSVYLRKVRGRPNARDQLTAFLTSLFKAVEGSPRGTLVYTLAVGKDGRPATPTATENQFIADKMAEAESVSARKATLLNPTEDDETAHVLRRRLFSQIDEPAAALVVEAYKGLWAGQREALSPQKRPIPRRLLSSAMAIHSTPTYSIPSPARRLRLPTSNACAACCAFRTHGGATVELDLPTLCSIHLHHIDPGYEAIRQEICHAARPVDVCLGDPKRHQWRSRQKITRSGNRRRGVSRHATLCQLRGANGLHAHPGLQ